MHSVNIGIRGNHDVVVTQVVQSVFNVECRLQQIEFLIFVYYFFCKTKTIQWFTTQAENSLGIYPGFSMMFFYQFLLNFISTKSPFTITLSR